MRLQHALLVACATVVLSPSLHAQYYYPPGQYGSMPRYVSPYAQNPMMARPVQSYPPPMQRAPVYYQPQNTPRIYSAAPVQVETKAPVVTTTPTVVLPAQPPGEITTIVTEPPGAAPTIGDSPRRTGGFYTGTSFLLVRPYFSNNPAFTTRSGITTPSPQDTATELPWNYEAAFAAWAGWTTECGLGFRGRFFSIDQSSKSLSKSLTVEQGATTNIRPPGNLLNLAGSGGSFGSNGIILGNGLGQDFLTFNSRLKIHTIDAEATWDMVQRNWGLQFAGGARYLYMSQDYAGQLRNTIPGASETQSLTVNQSVTGAGPTLAFQANFQLGCGFSLFGNVRGSLIVDHARQTTNFTQVIVDPNNLVGGSQSISPGNSSSRGSIMPIAEIEIGMEYMKSFGQFQPFLRTSAVNQTYFDAGSASQLNGNLSLFGVQLTAGFKY